MNYDEEEVIKILKIQARALKNIEGFAREMAVEINNQKKFIKQLLSNIKQARAHEEAPEEAPEEKNEELFESPELPSNVLPFAVERKQED